MTEADGINAAAAALVEDADKARAELVEERVMRRRAEEHASKLEAENHALRARLTAVALVIRP